MSEAIASKAERLAAYNANIAAAEKDPSLSPETGKPLSKMNAARFGAGFLVFGVLWMSGLGIVSAVLLPMHYKTIPGVNADALVGIVNAFTAVASLVANLMFGNFSDRSRSRFGRRTPWILGGAVLYGVAIWVISLPTSGLTIGIAYCIGLIGLNAVQAPLLTIISDRVPEDFRATASAAVGGGGVAGQAIGMLIASLFINHVEIGFIVAAVFALLSGVLSIIIFPREPSNVDMPREETSVGQILIHTLTPPTKGASDFWKAFICRTCLIVAYQMITSYQLYILQDHIGLSNTDAAKAISVMAIITIIVSFIAAIISGPLSDAIKRRKPPILVACILYAIGIAMPWFIPSVAGMFLFAGIAGFGYGMYSAVDQALNVDVLPNKKDAGKDLGILNIATCAGQAIGSFVTSSIVTMTHNYNLVFPTAIVIALCAGASVLTIKRIK